MEEEHNRINRSYFWVWDDKQGWNYTTFFSFYNDFMRTDTDIEYVEFGFILLLSLCSFIVNFLLILFFLTKKDLRTQQHMYTVSIMLSSLILAPFAGLIGTSRMYPKGWTFGNGACQATLFILIATAFIKIWLMTLISVDRYIRVVHAHNRFIARRISVILMVAAWILPAATIAGMVFPNSESKYVPDVLDGITICTVAFKYDPEVRHALIYFSTIFVLEFLLPTTIMIVCYSRIMRKINKSKAALLKHANHNQTKLTPSARSVDRSLRSIIRRKRTTVILITILGLFLFMWIPLFVLLAIVTLDQILETFQLSSQWVVAQVCVLLLNTLIEPFMYSFTTSKVRNELRRTFKDIRIFKPREVMSSTSFIDESSTHMNSGES